MQEYTNLKGNRSHVVNTGWSMLALIDAGQVMSLCLLEYMMMMMYSHVDVVHRLFS